MTPTSEFPGTHFYKSGVIYAQNDLCSGVWILMSGKVALGMRSERGKSVSISYVEPGAILGLAEVLGGRNYLATAVAATDVQVHFIPSEDIFAMFRDDPTTGMELVQALCADLNVLYEKLRHLRSA